jgi:hypothetical protein
MSSFAPFEPRPRVSKPPPARSLLERATGTYPETEAAMIKKQFTAIIEREDD